MLTIEVEEGTSNENLSEGKEIEDAKVIRSTVKQTRKP